MPRACRLRRLSPWMRLPRLRRLPPRLRWLRLRQHWDRLWWLLLGWLRRVRRRRVVLVARPSHLVWLVKRSCVCSAHLALRGRGQPSLNFIPDFRLRFLERVGVPTGHGPDTAWVVSRIKHKRREVRAKGQ